MGKAKFTLDQVIGYEERSKEKTESNLQTVEENLVRLMQDLADRKDYNTMKDMERIRKRFSFLNQKIKEFFPQKILRKEDQAKFSDPIIVNIFILLDELLYRDATLFMQIIPKIEELVELPGAGDQLKFIFNHISLMLCRMERVITLKTDVKNSTGQNALKTIRTQIPDFFPKHFRSEIKKELEKLHFEDIELNLLQDEKYDKFFFNEIIGTSTAYEQEVIQSVLSTVSVQFDGIQVALDELKDGQAILKQTQDALGGGLEALYEGQQDLLENMDALQATMETKIDDYLAQTKESDSLQKQARALETKLESAKPADRDAVNKTLMDMQLKYVELTEKLESDLNSITQGVSSVLDKEEDMDIYMKTRLSGDFSNISNEFKLMREGKVTRKRFVGDCLKLVGKKMLSIFSPFKL
ncbi:MAG TPA: hypothetical protein VKK79_24870 [Candidatus Lokiarchaeia archaeon]|nr:hypothetical protein [Candidatus Lokiarchaeia archaeon]